MTMRLAGAVLAGGLVTRMGGSPKGLFKLARGRSVLDHLIGQMRAAGVSDVLINANETERYARFGVEVVPDLRPCMGPLGGIEAILSHVSEGNTADGVLFLPCDMPAITACEIRRLMDAFLDAPDRVAYAYVESAAHPSYPVVCVVPVGLHEEITDAIGRWHLKIGRLWDDLDARTVVFRDSRPFYNVNTSEDLKAWHATSG